MEINWYWKDKRRSPWIVGLCNLWKDASTREQVWCLSPERTCVPNVVRKTLTSEGRPYISNITPGGGTALHHTTSSFCVVVLFTTMNKMHLFLIYLHRISWQSTLCITGRNKTYNELLCYKCLSVRIKSFSVQSIDVKILFANSRRMSLNFFFINLDKSFLDAF